jgi:hypothetical protein
MMALKKVFKVNRGKTDVGQDAANVATFERREVENQAVFGLFIRVKLIMLHEIH